MTKPATLFSFHNQNRVYFKFIETEILVLIRWWKYYKSEKLIGEFIKLWTWSIWGCIMNSLCSWLSSSFTVFISISSISWRFESFSNLWQETVWRRFFMQPLSFWFVFSLLCSQCFSLSNAFRPSSSSWEFSHFIPINT